MDKVFQYHDGELWIESVPLAGLARQYGTPLYVYSRTHMREQYRELAAAMEPVSPLICYSVKANSNGAVLRTFFEMGAGADVVSTGELFRARRAGCEASKIVFAGVGKTRDEIDFAIREGILFFTVESLPEARRISACAARLNKKARIAFRVNPDVDPKTHKYISTGKKENKFGLDIEQAKAAMTEAAELPGVSIVGLHMHIGSQILEAAPFNEALTKVRTLCTWMKKKFETFEYLDIGGGIGIQYKPDQEPLAPAAYAKKLLAPLQKQGLKVVLEPGRFLVGNAGALLTTVQYVKEGGEKVFLVCDAAMNDLIRPALYQAHHEVVAVRQTPETCDGDLVGPICESGDFLAADRTLPAVGEGGLIAVLSTGAYGMSMASNYNSRRRPAEVLVDTAQHWLIRRRESWRDLVKDECEAGS